MTAKPKILQPDTIFTLDISPPMQSIDIYFFKCANNAKNATKCLELPVFLTSPPTYSLVVI